MLVKPDTPARHKPLPSDRQDRGTSRKRRASAGHYRTVNEKYQPAVREMLRQRRTARVAPIVSALLIGSAVAAIESSTYRIGSLGALVFGLAVAATPLRASEVERYRRRHQRLAGPRPGAWLGA